MVTIFGKSYIPTIFEKNGVCVCFIEQMYYVVLNFTQFILL